MAQGPKGAAVIGTAVAAVLDGDSRLGTAFLVTDRLLVTCAHVLKRGMIPMAVGEVVQLHFTQLADRPMATARITVNTGFGQHDSDVALLELESGHYPAPGATWLALSDAEAIDGHSYRTCGYPGQMANALPSGGLIEGDQHYGLLVLKNTAAIPLGPGYSGAPVYDPEVKGVVGMVSELLVTQDARAGAAVSALTILKACPVLARTVARSGSLRQFLTVEAQSLKTALLPLVLEAAPALPPDVDDPVEYESAGSRGTAYFTAWSSSHPFNQAFPDDGDLFFCVSLTGRKDSVERLQVEIALELSGRGVGEYLSTGQAVRFPMEAFKAALKKNWNDLLVEVGDWGGTRLVVRHSVADPLEAKFVDRLLNDWKRLSEVCQTVLSELRVPGLE